MTVEDMHAPRLDRDASTCERTVVLHLTGMRLVSPNERRHWGTRRRTEACQQRELWGVLQAFERPAGPWHVTIVRVGLRRLDDDNATASAKHIRDSIADWLHVDDGDETRVCFEVRQERGPYAVRVEIRGARP